MSLSRRFFLLSTAAAMLASAGTSLAQAQQTLRVSAIPDESPTELQRKFKPLGDYLSKAIGMKVEFTPVTDYAAAVEALINRKVDLVWYGGFTFVQAKNRSNNGVVPIAQRVEDQLFQSVFIATDPSIRSLADLRGKTVSFGSASSTSGHLMPRYFLLQAGIDPDRDLRRIAFSGAHDATAFAVAGGRVDAGALNISVWQKLVADGRVDPKKVMAFYTTPGYVDYTWTVRKDMDRALRDRLTQAFLNLNPRDAEHKAILDLQRTLKFVPTRAESYDSIEQVARSAGLLK